jgi:hypothetical protein
MLLRRPSGLGRDISLSCNEPGSCPCEIGAGLDYALLKSVAMATELSMDGIIKHTASMLVNIFLLVFMLPDVRRYRAPILTRRRKKSAIGYTRSIVADRKSPLQVFRGQAGWQVVGDTW